MKILKNKILVYLLAGTTFGLFQWFSKFLLAGAIAPVSIYWILEEVIPFTALGFFLATINIFSINYFNAFFLAGILGIFKGLAPLIAFSFFSVLVWKTIFPGLLLWLVGGIVISYIGNKYSGI